MTSLEAFVNEQKKKSEGGFASSSLSSLSDLRSKLPAALSSFSLSSSAGDTEVLIESESGRGILNGGKNRKTSGWLSGEEWVFGLSRTQRLFAFFLFLLGAAFCFTTSAFLLPVLLLQTRKFAALNTMGSVMILASFLFVWGPLPYASNLLAPSRRLVTVCYVSSIFATLYSSLWLRSVVFTFIASTFQAVSLVCFVLSAVPGGERGLRLMASMFGRLCKSQSSTVLPI